MDRDCAFGGDVDSDVCYEVHDDSLDLFVVEHAEVCAAFTEAPGHAEDAGFSCIAGSEFAVH